MDAAETSDDADDDGYLPAGTDVRTGDDDNPGDDVEEAHARKERRGRRPPVSWTHCRGVLADIAESIVQDAPPGNEPDDISGAKQRIAAAVNALVAAAEGPGGASRDDGGSSGQASNGGGAWPDRAAVAVAGWKQEVDGIRDAMDVMVNCHGNADKAESRRAWREWLCEGIDAGASRAHAATRLPQEVAPTVVQTTGGTMSAAPE